VLDLAAGTGKLTRLLIAAYDRVLAVEPQDEMRRLLSRICPEAEIFAGTAEQIPLEASSVDVVFVAEAFHLFGSQHTVAEIARVLRLDGILILMWNFPAEPWEPSITAVERYYANASRNLFRSDSPFADWCDLCPLSSHFRCVCRSVRV
jgi:ubiquinone/menaquinone biosynthesis C-methylase UbiE